MDHGFKRSARYHGSSRGRIEHALFTHPSLPVLHDPEVGIVDVEQASLGGLSVGRVTSSGHDVEIAEMSSFSLLFPQRGTIITETESVTLKSGGTKTLIVPPGPRRTRVDPGTAAAATGIAIIVNASAFRDANAEVGNPDVPADQQRYQGLELGYKTPAVRSLAGFARLLVSELENPSLILASEAWQIGWTSLMAHALLRVLADTHVGSFDPGRGSTLDRRRVVLSEDFIRAHFAEPLTVADLAAVASCSARSIATAFRRVRDTTPHAYLTSVRLEAAPAALLTAERTASVTSVALDCGFTHLGRFALLYRGTFGELPSETLARRW